MKKLEIPATVKVERTESGGNPRERLTFTPVGHNEKLGPADTFTLTVDEAGRMGLFKDASEVDIVITAREDETETKKKGKHE